MKNVTDAEYSEKVCMSESSTNTPVREMMSIDDFVNQSIEYWLTVALVDMFTKLYFFPTEKLK